MTETGQKMEGLMERIPHAMQAFGAPGASVALLHEGRLIWSHGFGSASVKNNTPVTSETVFEAASLSKPVVAAAALALCESGLLSLDAPLSKYLSEPDLLDDPQFAQITLRRVLSHTSGLPNWRPKRFSPKPGPLTINFAPGARFGYSGEGFECLRQAIENVTGQPFADYLRVKMLLPLAMTSNGYVWRPEYEEAMAQGYNGRGKPAPLSKFTAPNAAFSLYSTPTDYSRFVLYMMRPELNGMLVPQTPLTDVLSWGLGWGLWQQNGQLSFWHWGDNGPYQCFVTASTTDGDGLVIMTNGQKGQSVCREAVTELLGKLHPAFAWLEESFYGAKLA